MKLFLLATLMGVVAASNTTAPTTTTTMAPTTTTTMDMGSTTTGPTTPPTTTTMSSGNMDTNTTTTTASGTMKTFNGAVKMTMDLGNGTHTAATLNANTHLKTAVKEGLQLGLANAGVTGTVTSVTFSLQRRLEATPRNLASLNLKVDYTIQLSSTEAAELTTLAAGGTGSFNTAQLANIVTQINTKMTAAAANIGFTPSITGTLTADPVVDATPATTTTTSSAFGLGVASVFLMLVARLF